MKKKDMIIGVVCIAIIGVCGFNFSLSLGEATVSLHINSILGE